MVRILPLSGPRHHTTANSWLNTIIQGELIEALASIPDQSVDVVFADPPRDLRADCGFIHAGSYQTYREYDVFTRAWLKECRRVLKPTGTLWTIGGQDTIFRIGSALQDLNFWLLNDIIWRKTSPSFSADDRRFPDTHETIIWASRDATAKSYTFNYDAMKAANDDVQMRSDWLILSPDHDCPVDIANGTNTRPHRPEALLSRILLPTSKPGDIVLDPFFGAGVTGAVAKRLGRHFIGVETNPDLIERAQARIAAVVPLGTAELGMMPSKRARPRVAFNKLIETGLISTGQVLTDQRRRYSAVVGSDGNLSAGDLKGSIHRIGARVQGLEGCNGWTFWHVDNGRGLRPIDDLRGLFRGNIASSAAPQVSPGF